MYEEQLEGDVQVGMEGKGTGDINIQCRWNRYGREGGFWEAMMKEAGKERKGGREREREKEREV